MAKCAERGNKNYDCRDQQQGQGDRRVTEQWHEEICFL